MIAIAGRHAAMPDIGHEQPGVARLGQQRLDLAAFVVEPVVEQAVPGRRSAGVMAAGQDAGGPSSIAQSLR
ncbi:MAG: hypothetical protein WDM85_14675 [Caulobacteraceae bacterium]